jgi:hypothetical protein
MATRQIGAGGVHFVWELEFIMSTRPVVLCSVFMTVENRLEGRFVCAKTLQNARTVRNVEVYSPWSESVRMGNYSPALNRILKLSMKFKKFREYILS